MLQLIDVKKIYKTKAGDVAALDGVSLLFPETGMVFVTGKSGSGKTTLLNVIGGLDGIDGGEILVYGKKFSEFSASEYDSYRNTLIGFIFQEYNLLPDYNIEKNVGIADELQGKKTDKEGLERVLSSVGIDSFEGRKPGQLSGGQKQRVAIARALIKNPKIIMADEPTGALDSVTGIQVVEELKRLSKEKLVIVISHDLELAKKYADRIIRLVDGKVVEDVTIEEQELKENVIESNEAITVKSGSDLSSAEKDLVAQAIKNKKSIVVTHKPTIKIKKPTNEGDIKTSDEKVKLIKSKMKFKSSAMLGVKSLKVKPLRLIFTILLSAIAFTVFGVFDTIASYSRSRVVADFLKNGDLKTISVAANERTQDGEKYNLNLKKEVIGEIASQTGYNFKPIYGVQSFVSNLILSPNNSPVYDLKSSLGVNISRQSKGKGYYVPKITGVVEFSESERNMFGKINEYGYTLVCGKYPVLEYEKAKNEKGEEVDVLITDSIYNVAISKYLADTIIHHNKDSKGNPTSILFGTPITTYTDLLEKKIMPDKAYMAQGVPEFKIVGIYDTGTIPSKYDVLKVSYVKSNNDPQQPLIDELSAYISSGAEQLLFVAEGAIDESIEFLSRPNAYFAPTAEYKIENDKKGSSSLKKTFYDLFYTTESATKADNVMMFDPEREALDSYTLAKNEILINYKDLEFIFEKEKSYSYTITHTGANGKETTDNGNTILNGLLYAINSNGTSNLETLKRNVKNALDCANKLRFYDTPEFNPETATPEQKEEYKNSRYTRNATLTKTLISNSNATVTEFKVVGIYFFDVNNIIKTSTSQLYPFLASEETLSGLGVSLNQGRYSRLLSTKNTTSKTGAELGDYITENQGLTLYLYGNDVLSTLEYSETQILQFTNLFLYASLVLAIFSMFMLFNYISTSIASKRQSIGILRALGSNRLDVFKMFLTESLIISIISALFASVLSYFACDIVNYYIKDIMSLMVNFAIYGVRQIILIFIIGVFTGILASIVPIIKIAREKPVELIRRP